MPFFGARVWKFLIFGSKFWILDMSSWLYTTVFHEESESAVRIDEFLDPEEKIEKNRPTRVSTSEAELAPPPAGRQYTTLKVRRSLLCLPPGGRTPP